MCYIITAAVVCRNVNIVCISVGILCVSNIVYVCEYTGSFYMCEYNLHICACVSVDICVFLWIVCVSVDIICTLVETVYVSNEI